MVIDIPLKNSPNTNNVFRNIQFVCFSKHIFFLIFAQNVCISNKKNKQLLWNNNTKKKQKKNGFEVQNAKKYISNEG